MAAKSTTMSVRMTEGDFEFISGLEVTEAKTPSDKIRYIIGQYKEMLHSTGDYGKGLRLLKNLTQEPNTILLENGRKLNLHSELLNKFVEWATETLAYYITTVPEPDGKVDEKFLKEFEDGIAKRIFSLVEFVLRLGVTEKAPCYDPGIIKTNMDPILEIASIIEKVNSNKEK